MNESLTPFHPRVLRRDQRRFISFLRLFGRTNEAWVLNTEKTRAALDDHR